MKRIFMIAAFAVDYKGRTIYRDAQGRKKGSKE